MSLTALLEEGVRFAPHYKPDNNSDHLPMTLAAIHGLGGSEQDLLAFRSTYQTRLHLWQESEPITDWRQGLGRADTYGALVAWFGLQIEQESETAVLAATLPTLLPGIALDAFHPIIRLGFARDFNSMSETAAALAYMVSVYRELPSGHAPIILRQQLQQQVDSGPVSLKSSRFGPSILELAERGLYPGVSAGSLAEVAGVALDIYRATRNFFALHLVTATQAIRCAVPESMDLQGRSAMTSALLAAHQVLGSPDIGDVVLPAPGRLDPEHAYKYCWACLSEYRAYGDERYLQEIEGFVTAGLVPAWVRNNL